eukprot:SAG31_NODE_308_length_17951_cov_4.779240_11_plen_184_part_00
MSISQGGAEPELGEYKLLVECVCYEGKELGSPKKDYVLEEEELFKVIETATVDGVVRVRSEDGWINLLDPATEKSVLINIDDLGDEEVEADSGDGVGDTVLAIIEKPGMLGMTFGSKTADGSPPVCITKIKPTGLAAFTPSLRKGLVITEIQGDDVRGLKVSEVTAKIKNAGRYSITVFDRLR